MDKNITEKEACAPAPSGSVMLDARHGWILRQSVNSSIYYKGDIRDIEKLENLLRDGNITEALEFIEEQGCFASFIYERADLCVAWVDHIRSYPVFYTQTPEGLKISNNARFLESYCQDIDQTSSLELIMAGYVTGAHTLFKDLKALRPGEVLIAKPGETKVERWFQYNPVPDIAFDPVEGRRKLGKILDDITKAIIERAGGRPIWVPLSAGLDSRIILTKLHEHGCRNVETFSYGPRFNFEAKYAKRIAEKLGYPWRFVSVTGKEARSLFESEDRKDFWDFADNLKSLPSMREYTAMVKLHQTGQLPKDAILINGQSGDYITGGHIAPLWHEKEKTCSAAQFFDVMIGKHYDLWSCFKTPENIEKIKARIAEELPSGWQNFTMGAEWAAAEEIWEYDARQVILVINGQRIYDYLGYGWELPLWEKSLVNFCQTLPLEQKNSQQLYKDYLRQDYNYKGLFPANEPNIWRWPLPMLWVLPAARLVFYVGGNQAKKKFYALMRYFGHYSNQYAFFAWSTHGKLALKTRNIFSLYGFQWAYENPEMMPDNIKASLK